MAILSDFFLAECSTTPTYDGGAEFPTGDRCQLKGITPLEAAGIVSVLRGGADRIAMLVEFPFLTPEDADQWTMSVPADMTAALAKLSDSDLPSTAQQCAGVTAEELNWSPADFENVLRQLRDISRRAVETGKCMYLWNSL